MRLRPWRRESRRILNKRLRNGKTQRPVAYPSGPITLLPYLGRTVSYGGSVAKLFRTCRSGLETRRLITTVLVHRSRYRTRAVRTWSYLARLRRTSKNRRATTREKLASPISKMTGPRPLLRVDDSPGPVTVKLYELQRSRKRRRTRDRVRPIRMQIAGRSNEQERIRS